MMLQIKNLPDNLHKRLKIRAAQLGVSMSDYVVAELRRALEVPTREEFLARLRTGSRVELPGGAAAAVRAERDGR
jgi:plasmid stability protein